MEKLGRYFVMEHWGHIFSDGFERDVRFVIDTTKLGGEAEAFLVAMDIHVNHKWSELNWTGRDDVVESLNDNEVIGEIDLAMNGIEEKFDFIDEGKFTDTLPDWAQKE